jgi:hypothetical protein
LNIHYYIYKRKSFSNLSNLRRQGWRHGHVAGPLLLLRLRDVRVPQHGVLGQQHRVPGRPVERAARGQQLLQEPPAPPRRAPRRPEHVQRRVHALDRGHAR